VEDGAEAEEEEEECEEVDGEADGDDIEAILALGGSKCKSKELSGADALAAELSQCDMDGMDEKLAGCLTDMDTRVKTLEQAVLSGEGDKI
jgi:hypothetical protein